MERITIRMPRPMIDNLAADARARGLDISAYIRSQLTFNIERPHEIFKPKKEAVR